MRPFVSQLERGPDAAAREYRLDRNRLPVPAVHGGWLIHAGTGPASDCSAHSAACSESGGPAIFEIASSAVFAGERGLLAVRRCGEPPSWFSAAGS